MMYYMISLHLENQFEYNHVCIYIRFNHVYPLVIQHHGKSLFLMGTCGCKWTSFLKKKNAQKKLIANWFHCVDLHLLSKTSYSNQCIHFAGHYPASNGQTHDRTIYHVEFGILQLWIVVIPTCSSSVKSQNHQPVIIHQLGDLISLL